jgi:cellulose synthase/poly-beta-1,6-N-acetylglucosamine synthase-like glycosyltransferase
LDELFYIGQTDTRDLDKCKIVGVAMKVLLFAVAGLMAIQVLCSLLYLARRIPHFVEEDMAAAVMVMVPCYNESDKELQKTIDSILIMNDYPEENTVF